jgi:toxin YoeB
LRLAFDDQGWEDYLYWQENDRKKLRRINELIRATQRDPFEGIGKPEALRHGWTGYWSRRIDEENRLVYRIVGDTLVVAQCRFHY